MPGPSGDEDGNAGALPVPACPRHRGHYGGGKPFQPMLHPMRNAVPLAGPEWQAPSHSSVRQGSGAEEAAAIGGVVEGDLREGI